MRDWTTNRTVVSSSNIPATNTYLPGGTLVVALGLWTGRFLTSEVDPTQMGRWSCMNIWGGKEMVVSVYSAYRVPQDNLPGPLTAYAQKYKILTDAGQTDPRPQRQLITDLIKDITKKLNTGNHKIIIGIDVNDILETDNMPVKKHSITSLKRECGLTDIFEHQHGHVGDTSAKKRHKIDHILVSENVLSSVVRSGFLLWGVAMASDHRIGFVDLNVAKRFGDIEDNTHHSSRKLNTTYPERESDKISSRSIRVIHLEKYFDLND